jgi:hypothetical protein
MLDRHDSGRMVPVHDPSKGDPPVERVGILIPPAPAGRPAWNRHAASARDRRRRSRKGKRLRARSGDRKGSRCRGAVGKNPPRPVRAVGGRVPPLGEDEEVPAVVRGPEREVGPARDEAAPVHEAHREGRSPVPGQGGQPAGRDLTGGDPYRHEVPPGEVQRPSAEEDPCGRGSHGDDRCEGSRPCATERPEEGNEALRPHVPVRHDDGPERPRPIEPVDEPDPLESLDVGERRLQLIIEAHRPLDPPGVDGLDRGSLGLAERRPDHADRPDRKGCVRHGSS